MPKLSLWQSQKSNNYKFFDNQIRGMFTAGGADFGIHKYVGTINQNTGDATQPNYDTMSPTNIQDVLFLENRNRKYDEDVYVLRGHYQRTENDFDLSQFGLFLQTGTVIANFHHNDMVETLGRRIMSGDVIEFYHLQDDFALDAVTALKRFYVVGDCSWTAEGFSPTWYPHLWRVKLNPMANSQEYQDILQTINVTNTLGPMGTSIPAEGNPIADLMSTYNKYIGINEAIIEQANKDVPASGYDVSNLYGQYVDVNDNPAVGNVTSDVSVDTADAIISSADTGIYSPNQRTNPKAYLSGDGLAPNGIPVGAGVTFPINPNQGDYFLRLDYLPNRLFRYSGKKWAKMEDSVRTNLDNGNPNNKTMRNNFVNNTNTLTLANGDTIPSRQTLSQALRPKADI
jgi:hypothetical protein